MRQVKSFEDCNILFREIFSQLDLKNSKNWDMRKKRLVNASPSVDTYDYVVRKELLDAIKTVVPDKTTGTNTTVTTSKMYAVVFTNAGTVRTETQATGPYIFKRKSNAVIACVSAVSIPTSDAEFNLLHNGTRILNTHLVLPSTASSLDVVSSTDFTLSPVTFEVDDTLVLEVIAGGGARKLTVELVAREI